MKLLGLVTASGTGPVSWGRALLGSSKQQSNERGTTSLQPELPVTNRVPSRAHSGPCTPRLLSRTTGTKGSD